MLALAVVVAIAGLSGQLAQANLIAKPMDPPVAIYPNSAGSKAAAFATRSPESKATPFAKTSAEFKAKLRAMRKASEQASASAEESSSRRLQQIFADEWNVEETVESEGANVVTKPGFAYSSGTSKGGVVTGVATPIVGGADAYLQKIDSTNGAIVWAFDLESTTCDDEAVSHAVDSVGNVLALVAHGACASSELIKLNGATGALIWKKQLTTETGIADIAAITPTGVDVDASDDIFVGGTTTSTIVGGTSEGNSDFFVLKFSSAGVKGISRQTGAGFVEQGGNNNVKVDSSGNVFIFGTTTDGNPVLIKINGATGTVMNTDARAFSAPSYVPGELVLTAAGEPFAYAITDFGYRINPLYLSYTNAGVYTSNSFVSAGSSSLTCMGMTYDPVSNSVFSLVPYVGIAAPENIIRHSTVSPISFNAFWLGLSQLSGAGIAAEDGGFVETGYLKTSSPAAAFTARILLVDPPTFEPTPGPSADPTAQPTLSAGFLASLPAPVTPTVTSSLPKAKPYAYDVSFGSPILQYRPNGSLSANVGTATEGSHIGNNQYRIEGGDGPCVKAGGIYRGGVLTLGCDSGLGASTSVNEATPCVYEVTWLAPEFC